ncbi:GntR family transcriptional regulator [Acidobacteria bacterium AH-259-A15]|nr:GntR family transcriptional regulator [Acidobacteria bacterium AH-259-A15]
MIKFNLDKKVGLNFYDQIKGQLVSAIYCGKIQEGDRLPSMRELAEDLDVNYKTIRKVYLCLAREKYIEIVKGSGAFLQKRSGKNTYEQMRRRAIYKLLGEVSQKAKNLGLSPQKFVRLLEGYSSGANLRKLHLAVIDHEEEAFIFSRELKLRLGADVSPVSLSQIQGNGAAGLLKNSDYLLTTSWHMEEVNEVAERYGKTVVEIKPSHQIYTEILSAARDRNVAIVIQDEHTMHASWEIFMNIYYPSTEKKFWIAPIHREDLVEKIIQEADLIFVSPMCWDEMRKRTPTDKELKTYDNFISQETINHLKELQLLG